MRPLKPKDVLPEMRVLLLVNKGDYALPDITISFGKPSHMQYGVATRIHMISGRIIDINTVNTYPDTAETRLMFLLKNITIEEDTYGIPINSKTAYHSSR